MTDMTQHTSVVEAVPPADSSPTTAGGEIDHRHFFERSLEMFATIDFDG